MDHITPITPRKYAAKRLTKTCYLSEESVKELHELANALGVTANRLTTLAVEDFLSHTRYFEELKRKLTDYRDNAPGR